MTKIKGHTAKASENLPRINFLPDKNAYLKLIKESLAIDGIEVTEEELVQLAVFDLAIWTTINSNLALADKISYFQNGVMK